MAKKLGKPARSQSLVLRAPGGRRPLSSCLRKATTERGQANTPPDIFFPFPLPFLWAGEAPPGQERWKPAISATAPPAARYVSIGASGLLTRWSPRYSVKGEKDRFRLKDYSEFQVFVFLRMQKVEFSHFYFFDEALFQAFIHSAKRSSIRSLTGRGVRRRLRRRSSDKASCTDNRRSSGI